MLLYVLGIRLLPSLLFYDTTLPDYFLPSLGFIIVTSILSGFFFHSITTTSPTYRLRKTFDLKERNAGFYILGFLLVSAGLLFYGGLPPTITSIRMILFSGALEAAGLVSDSRYILTKGAYFGGEYRGQGLYMAVSSFGWAMLSVWQLYLTLKTPILREKLILLVIVIASCVYSWYRHGDHF